MADGGLFRGPQGRRQRRSAGHHTVDRALSASALLPTVAFAGLGTLTVLLVAQMGMSPLGAVVGPSAHDGGHAVTTPRMSVSTDPTRLNSLRSMSSRAATRASGPAAVGPETTVTLVTVSLPDSWQAPRVAMAGPDVSAGSAQQGAPETAPERAHGKSHAAQLAAKAHKATTRAVEHLKQVKHVQASRATRPLKPTKLRV